MHSRQVLIILVIIIVIAFSIVIWLKKEKQNQNEIYWTDKIKIGEVVRNIPIPIYEVPKEFLNDAITLLKDREFISINESDIPHFSKVEIRHTSNEVVYLARAVIGHSGTGMYSAWLNGNEIIIEHLSLGSHPHQENKAVLIVSSVKPKTIYYSHNIAK